MNLLVCALNRARGFNFLLLFDELIVIKLRFVTIIFVLVEGNESKNV